MNVPDSVRDQVRGLDGDLRRWRRHLHMNPELGFEEYETTAYILEQLDSLPFTIERPTKTGVVASIRGEQDGPTVALRADIDALPIKEENDVEYCSRRPGIMHACGHDGHTAILLGVAKVLAEHRYAVRGSVKLLFQHAEEVPPGGARELVDAGVLTDVDAVFGLHLISHIPRGRAGLRAGAIQAASDSFVIAVEGRGGHGAYPHTAIDAAHIGAQIVVNLQSIVSRRLDPMQPNVISVGRLEAGTANNVIAPRAVIEGTARTFDEQTRRVIKSEIERIATHTGAMADARCDVEYTFGYPPLVNDPAVTEVLGRAAAATLGKDAVFEMTPSLGADDFAYYAREVSASFLFLGAGRGDNDFPHHHPRFDIDEASLTDGVGILTSAVLAFDSESG